MTRRSRHNTSIHEENCRPSHVHDAYDEKTEDWAQSQCKKCRADQCTQSRPMHVPSLLGTQGAGRSQRCSRTKRTTSRWLRPRREHASPKLESFNSNWPGRVCFVRGTARLRLSAASAALLHNASASTAHGFPPTVCSGKFSTTLVVASAAPSSSRAPSSARTKRPTKPRPPQTRDALSNEPVFVSRRPAWRAGSPGRRLKRKWAEEPAARTSPDVRRWAEAESN